MSTLLASLSPKDIFTGFVLLRTDSREKAQAGCERRLCAVQEQEISKSHCPEDGVGGESSASPISLASQTFLCHPMGKCGQNRAVFVLFVCLPRLG
jgi:hypothetical protein